MASQDKVRRDTARQEVNNQTRRQPEKTWSNQEKTDRIHPKRTKTYRTQSNGILLEKTWLNRTNQTEHLERTKTYKTQSYRILHIPCPISVFPFWLFTFWLFSFWLFYVCLAVLYVCSVLSDFVLKDYALSGCVLFLAMSLSTVPTWLCPSVVLCLIPLLIEFCLSVLCLAISS